MCTTRMNCCIVTMKRLYNLTFRRIEKQITLHHILPYKYSSPSMLLRATYTESCIECIPEQIAYGIERPTFPTGIQKATYILLELKSAHHSTRKPSSQEILEYYNNYSILRSDLILQYLQFIIAILCCQLLPASSFRFMPFGRGCSLSVDQNT
jgi:hypothetical protein